MDVDTFASGSSFHSGKALGLVDGKRWAIIRAIMLRFHGDLPADLAASVYAIDDVDRLDTWYEAAITAPCMNTFRGMLAQFQCRASASV